MHTNFIQFRVYYTCLVLVITLTAMHAQELFASEGPLDLSIVPEEDFKHIFSDTNVTIRNEKTDEVHKNKFYSDGTVTSKRGNSKWRGIWYTDENNQHCIRWDHKDKSTCGIIMQDENGDWVKVKDNEIIRHYELIQPLPKTK